MIFILLVTILSVVITTALWFASLRPVDRTSLIAATLTKLGIRSWLLRRPILSKVKVSNGFEATVPSSKKAIIEEILNFKMRSDDVIVATYVKAGTTWMQEIVRLICNDADVENVDRERLMNGFAFLDIPTITAFGKGFQSAERWPQSQRRFIKTHMPFQLLPNELQKKGIGKMICVVRNPKDNCVSYYHFHRMNKLLPDPGTWRDFLTNFCTGNVFHGSWFDHVDKYWQVYQQRRDSMHFVSYESLKKDLKKEVMKLAKFLGKDLSEEQVNTIVKHCSFSSMSTNRNTNFSEYRNARIMNFEVSKFMRKGEVGDWKNHFTITENKAFDELYKERTKDWTLDFEFEPA